MKLNVPAKRGTKANTKIGSFSLITKKSNITEYHSDTNGLTVLIVQLPQSPTVTSTILYKVGSQDERTGETGLAHMLEHMLFKPTTGTGTKWKDLENKGAHLNATTWLDRTLYYFTLPKEYLDGMLEVEADRMRNVVLTQEEFNPERANVLSEYEIQNSKPDSVLEWEMVQAAFTLHGYHHDTIGFKSDIEQYSLKSLTSFYNKHYWPNNATLILVGDLNAKEVLPRVEKHFSSISNIPVIHTKPLRKEPIQAGVRRVSLIRETPLRYTAIAFKAPPLQSRSWNALTIALLYLSHGETSPLYKELVEGGHATEIGAHLYPTKDPFLAFFSIYATKEGNYAAIEEIVMREITILIKKGISEKKLKLIKEYILIETIKGRDGSHNIGTELAEYVATGNWKQYLNTLPEIESITREEVKNAAAEYLTLRNATIGTLEKESTTI